MKSVKIRVNAKKIKIRIAKNIDATVIVNGKKIQLGESK